LLSQLNHWPQACRAYLGCELAFNFDSWQKFKFVPGTTVLIQYKLTQVSQCSLKEETYWNNQWIFLSRMSFMLLNCQRTTGKPSGLVDFSFIDMISAHHVQPTVSKHWRKQVCAGYTMKNGTRLTFQAGKCVLSSINCDGWSYRVRHSILYFYLHTYWKKTLKTKAMPLFRHCNTGRTYYPLSITRKEHTSLSIHVVQKIIVICVQKNRKICGLKFETL